MTTHYTHNTEIEDFDDLAFHVDVELTCSERGQPAAPASMNFPGEPGFGPEFDVDSVLVNGVALDQKSFVALFGQETWDGIVNDAETAASETGEFG